MHKNERGWKRNVQSSNDLLRSSWAVSSGFKREAIPIKNHDAQSLIRWIHVLILWGPQVHVVSLSRRTLAAVDGAGRARATPPTKGKPHGIADTLETVPCATRERTGVVLLLQLVDRWMERLGALQVCGLGLGTACDRHTRHSTQASGTAEGVRGRASCEAISGVLLTV